MEMSKDQIKDIVKVIAHFIARHNKRLNVKKGTYRNVTTEEGAIARIFDDGYKPTLDSIEFSFSTVTYMYHLNNDVLVKISRNKPKEIIENVLKTALLEELAEANQEFKRIIEERNSYQEILNSIST